ncbi:MAG: YihA family ribosome biogenesis GTP-binding protein [Oscillospiraceae bacterium]|nr:YihA family ribosome biogenesis GTP-binding protein [Oscillospiraceae bacterium]MBQ5417520.1 YihA family ribosome biogenesis GTP-binding protein [Oscillospiraceae bacterium]MCR5168142.1 ribosome biogenesis GTP-binding protein YihA/YsxC [Oscillospiraceae bacterium]
MNINNAAFCRSYGEFEQIPPSDKCEIVFSGRSNVGKSSLINKVFNRKKLARVSSVPGKTATINFYSCDDIYAVDLPGYGYAKISKSEKQRWKRLIEGYLTSGRNIGLVFQLIDMRHAPSEDDLHMLDFLIDSQMPFAVVFTKADKLKPRERAERMEGFASEIPCYEDIKTICFSAETGEGAEEIRSIMNEFSDNG